MARMRSRARGIERGRPGHGACSRAACHERPEPNRADRAAARRSRRPPRCRGRARRRPGRAPMVIRGTGPLRPVLAAGEEKLDTRLRALLAPPAPGPSQLVPVPPPGTRGSKAHVYVRVDAADAEGLARLARAGLRVDHVDAEHGLVRGWLRAKDLRRLATLGLVRSVSPVRPGFVRAGSVDTQGDAAANAPAARASCAGCDGSGITVGVISDGIDHVAQSISTGDLPPGTGVPAGVGCARG